MMHNATLRFVVAYLTVLLMANEALGGQENPSRSADVMRLILPESNNAEVKTFQGRIYLALQKQARYLLTRIHPWQEDSQLLLLTESKSAEHFVRPNTGAIEGFAFLIRFGPYDESVVGVSRPKLLTETLLPMMRYVVATHVTGSRPTSDKKPWGDHWQSAHWAQMLGRAAWWIWDDLPRDLRDGVRRVIAHEADRIEKLKPPHNIKNDTKSEENAWNSQVLSVAVLLMPDDPRRPKWEAAFQRWVLSAFLRPADEHSGALVDGRPVSKQFTGANIYDDFTLENHGFVHPDYMTAFSLSLGCALDYAMTKRRPPEALLYNVPGIYENLKWMMMPDGSFVYPNGQDWELFRSPAFFVKHVLMAVFGRDAEAWSLAVRCMDTLEKMQSRSPSGAVYYEGEYFFPSTQTDLFRALAVSWLALQTPQTIARGEYHDRMGVRQLDAGKIILNRTGAAVHTFSWGAKVMAQCVPNRLDRVVSPHQQSGVGLVRLKGEKAALAVKVHDVQVTNSDKEFEARLVLDHGVEKVRAFLAFRSAADGTWTMSEKLVALSNVATAEIATGMIGILNNPTWIYERGERRIRIDNTESVVVAASGMVLQNDAAKRLSVDDVLEIRSDNPLHILYIGAKGYDRGRMTDNLYLNSIRGEKEWRAGDVISEFAATVKCSPGAAAFLESVRGSKTMFSPQRRRGR